MAFDAVGLPTAVQHLAHLLIIAEVRAVICSGPPRGTEHTYVLVDEVVPPAPSDDLAERRRAARADPAVHQRARPGIRARPGPVVDPDADARSAAPWLTSRVFSSGSRSTGTSCGSTRGWRRAPRTITAPTCCRPSTRSCLTYAQTGFPRRNPDATRQRLLSESGGGIVVVRGEDVGIWKRAVSAKDVRVTVWPDVPLGRDDRDDDRCGGPGPGRLRRAPAGPARLLTAQHEGRRSPARGRRPSAF